jgi:hypothetical protein
MKKCMKHFPLAILLGLSCKNYKNGFFTIEFLWKIMSLNDLKIYILNGFL